MNAQSMRGDRMAMAAPAVVSQPGIQSVPVFFGPGTYGVTAQAGAARIADRLLALLMAEKAKPVSRYESSSCIPGQITWIDLDDEASRTMLSAASVFRAVRRVAVSSVWDALRVMSAGGPKQKLALPAFRPAGRVPAPHFSCHAKRESLTRVVERVPIYVIPGLTACLTGLAAESVAARLEQIGRHAVVLTDVSSSMGISYPFIPLRDLDVFFGLRAGAVPTFAIAV